MVEINKVYSTVLTLGNKESNSFIQPTEFNDIAEKAQSEIFESYFSEIQAAAAQSAAVADDDYSDVGHNLKEKISLFEEDVTLNITSSNADFEVDQSNFYRFGKLFLPNYSVEIEEVSFSEIATTLNSPYYCPSADRPVYVKVSGSSTNPFGFRVFPRAQFSTGDNPTLTSGVDTVLLQYVRKPATPRWVGSTTTGQLVPAPADANYQNFELHPSEFHNLVNKICKSFGIIIRDPQLISYFSAEDQLIDQKEQ